MPQIRLKLIIFLSLATLSYIFTTNVFAINLTGQQETIFSQNDLIFYEPCDDSQGANECNISVSGSTMEEKIWNGLTSFMTDEQAAGVMGNMAHEGGFNPARHENAFIEDSTFDNFKLNENPNISYGIGLIQWSGNRRVNLYNFLEENNADLLNKYIDDGRSTYGNLGGSNFLSQVSDSDVDTLTDLELCFLKQELENNSSYKGVLDTETVEDATDYFLENIEVPANIEETRSTRREDAQKYYDQFHNKTADSSSSQQTSDPSCNSCEQGSLNINGAAVCLAWPLNSTADASWATGSATNTFNIALDTLDPKHGNSAYQLGADCGRFTSIVVQWSGVDTNFPGNLSSGSKNQLSYARESDKWDVYKWDNNHKPQPGDILLGMDNENSIHHSYIYIQDKNGENYIAEASSESHYGKIYKKDKKINGTQYNLIYILHPKNAHNSTTGVSVTNGVESSSDGGAIATVTDTSNISINCNRSSNCGGNNSSGKLKEGGFQTAEEAKSWMQAYIKEAAKKQKGSDFYLGAYVNDGKCAYGTLNNCTAFSQWFVNKYTTIGGSNHKGAPAVDGKYMVSELGKISGVTTGSEPHPYAVFSEPGVVDPVHGHTGVVLGVTSDYIIIGEAACSSGPDEGWPRVSQISISEAQQRGFTYAYMDNVLNSSGI